jgi:hypothetical protein
VTPEEPDLYVLAEAHDNELVNGVPRWRWEEIGRKHADDEGVTEDEFFEDEPEDEEIEELNE